MLDRGKFFDPYKEKIIHHEIDWKEPIVAKESIFCERRKAFLYAFFWVNQLFMQDTEYGELIENDAAGIGD